MIFSPLLKQLIESLQILPEVGPKSAQRMAFYLLERDREGAERLSHMLMQAVKQVGHCARCRTLSEKRLCFICDNPNRDQSVLCVVGGPLQMAAIRNRPSGIYLCYPVIYRPY